MTIDASNAPTGDAFQINNSPVASGTKSLMALGPADIAGGNGQGTYIGINAANGYTGDMINLQVNGSKSFEVNSFGNVTAADIHGAWGSFNQVSVGTGGTGTIGEAIKWGAAARRAILWSCKIIREQYSAG